jgi:ribonuclease D
MIEDIITRPEELPACCDYLAACRQFGLDTEFVGEETYEPRLCLVQVATEEKRLLIDPLSVGPLDPFWAVVTDPANLVVVHAGREEVRLCRLWSGKPPGNLFDLQIAAGLAGLPYPLGHGTLVNQLLGVQLAKGETLTEWRNRPLTRQQIRYAFDDVRYLLPLWQKLSARLDELGRRDWAKEEFGRLAETAAPDEPDLERWRRLRGLGSLDRRQLAIVRELYRWREMAAAQLNRPARTIVRDDLVVEIARRNPRRDHDLQVVRGLHRRHIGELLAAVERARSLSPDQLPEAIHTLQDTPQTVLLANLLTAVLGDFCARRQLASNLVANNQELRTLVRSKLQNAPLPDDLLLNQGWRKTQVLPELLAVLEGRRTLRVADLAAEAPFEVKESGRF